MGHFVPSFGISILDQTWGHCSLMCTTGHANITQSTANSILLVFFWSYQVFPPKSVLRWTLCSYSFNQSNLAPRKLFWISMRFLSTLCLKDKPIHSQMSFSPRWIMITWKETCSRLSQLIPLHPMSGHPSHQGPFQKYLWVLGTTRHWAQASGALALLGNDRHWAT